MDSFSNGTIFVKDQISRCEDIDELKEVVLPMIQDQKNLWQKKINEIVSESPLTKTAFAEKCHVSRVTLDKWLKGSIPRDREKFISVALAAGYDLPETNKLLTRYGRYSELYSKTLGDCVAIYVIKNEPPESRSEKYDEILERINAEVLNSEESDSADVSTDMVNEKLYEVRNVDALQRFIVENSNVFSKAYSKLFAAVNMFIAANYTENVEKLSLGQGWSSSLKHTVYEIKNGTWHPNRNKIISLGIHLSMTHEEVDELLGLAHMEPLYSKNTFEGLIMFALDSAEMEGRLRPDKSSGMSHNGAEEYFDPDDLLRYTLDIFREFDDPEVKDFLKELEGINDE